MYLILHLNPRARSCEVILGAHNVRQSEPEQVVFNVPSGNIKVHENWDTRKILNDVAIIKLDTDIPFSSRIQKVNLPRRSDVNDLFVGEQCTTSGWGKPSDCK